MARRPLHDDMHCYHLRIDTSFLMTLEKIAFDEERTISQQVRYFLFRYLRRDDRQDYPPQYAFPEEDRHGSMSPDVDKTDFAFSCSTEEMTLLKMFVRKREFSTLSNAVLAVLRRQAYNYQKAARDDRRMTILM